MITLQIDDYDNHLDVIDKVNRALAAHGLTFKDDGEVHDTYGIWTLEAVSREPDVSWITEWLDEDGHEEEDHCQA